MGRDAPASNGDRRTKSGGIWRLAWRGVRISRTMAMVLVLVASLAANAALFVGGVLYNVIDDAIESATGLATATGKQRKAADDLKRKNRQLVARNRKLQNGITAVRQKNGRLKSRITRLRKVSNNAVQRTVNRSAKAAVRAVATAPGKALPYVGTAVVMGATALEIKDLCATIRDMQEIQREIDMQEIQPEIDPSESHSEEEKKVCGMEIPTQEEILNRIEMSSLSVWQSSQKFVTDLNPIPPEFETRINLWLKDQKNFIRDSWDGLSRWFRGPDKVNGD